MNGAGERQEAAQATTCPQCAEILPSGMRFCGYCGAPLRAIPARTAERRQVSVMFCDLIGSTTIAGRLDPEDMRDVLRDYQDAATRAIRRYDGFVAEYLGDGVVGYFG